MILLGKSQHESNYHTKVLADQKKKKKVLA